MSEVDDDSSRASFGQFPGEYTTSEEEESDDEEEIDVQRERVEQAPMATPPRVVTPRDKSRPITSPQQELAEDTTTDEDEEEDERPTKKPRRTHSIANEDFEHGNIVLVHVDLETGGPHCGVIQLAVVMYDWALREETATWNSYIRPPKDATWCEHAIRTHGLTADDRRILDADDLETVWSRFKAFVEEHTNYKKGVLCAWNGKACDVEWLFRITEETHHGRCKWPSNLEYFLDPARLIRNYKRCQLNPDHKDCPLQGLGLAEVYCYVTNKTKLDGAHDALKDAQAQCVIVHDERVYNCLNYPNGIELVDSILEPKRKAREKAQAELSRSVPVGWWEGCDLSSLPSRQRDMSSSDRQQEAYNSTGGGGVRGPSRAVKDILRSKSIVDLFLHFFQLRFLETVADETNRYGNSDWVKPTASYWENLDQVDDDRLDDDDAVDEDDEDAHTRSRKRRKVLVSCRRNADDARHRCNKSRDWIKVTPGFILVYFGIILIHGALRMRRISQLWGETWQSNIPYVQNACTEHAFNQIRRFIHFINNATLYGKGDIRYNPIQKIQAVLDYLQKRLAEAYILGDRLSIDESMIKYCGKFISWIQYMPKKPIKHGIKVYALCCAYTGYLYAFEIYTGKNGSKKGTPRYVIERLLEMSGILPLVGATARFSGRILYTDNWYTSLEVMQYVYETFGMMLVGTTTLTQKKSRTADDYPFHRVKNSSMKKVPRGWMRIATQSVKSKVDKLLYVVQGTVWKDKKLVAFLHNHMVEPITQWVVQRYDSDRKRKRDIESHPVVTDYNQYMGGVDAKDRDTADWSVSLKSNRFYMRIFYWIFDSVIHAMWVLVKETMKDMDETELAASSWNSFKGKDKGRQTFQMTLGILLIKKGLEMDWKGEGPDRFKDLTGRPPYCRKINLIPCECRKNGYGILCFFCEHQHTNGIEHQKKGAKRRREAGRNVVVRKHAVGSRWHRMKACGGARYCGPCYDKAKEMFPSAKAKDLKKVCNHTIYGCKACKRGGGQFICKQCRKEYVHDDD